MGVVANMADFPPNPEDGELWLPSYIIHEISTTNTTATHPKSTPKNNVVFPPHIRRNHPPSRSTFEICFGSFGTKVTADSTKVTADSEPAANKLSPAPVISFHKPVTPTTALQGFDGRKYTAVIEKYGGTVTGTGVFLPRSMNVIAATGGSDGGGKKSEEMSGGTGVFLNHQVAVTRQRKKTSDNEEETLENNKKKKCCTIIKEENLGKRENYQHLSGICLPKDWTY